MINEVQSFWTGLRMAVMHRQPGLTWDDVGRMPITYFFHALRLSEKSAPDPDGQKLSRASKRAE